MLRWLILIQAVAYLLVVPMLRAELELGYHPPLIATLIALTALLVGGFLFPLRRSPLHAVHSDVDRLRPASWLLIAWLGLTIAYALVVIRYGLFDRRQGSEVMAELYATLPLPILGILRVYELLLIPIIILYMYHASSTPRWQRVAILLGVLASLPFMGLADSRSRLIVMGMSLIAFLPPDRFLRQLYRNWQLLLAGAGAILAFSVISSERAARYASVNDYLFSEVYVRLDGLNLVSKLREAGLLSWWGSFDFAMAGPLLSKIPFLEAAQTAKLLGRTSTKQYVINDLLRSNSFDDSNSMILDPLYFGGLLGLFIGFLVMMVLARVFDQYIMDGKLMINRFQTALAMTFATGIVVFENDWLGSFVNMGLLMLLIFGLLTFCTTKGSDVALAKR